MDYISVRQAAEKWGVSMRWVQAMIKDNRIAGVERLTREWLVPKDAPKPEDLRKLNGRKPKNKTDGTTKAE